MSYVEKLIFNNMSCETHNRYMILSWLMCAFFVDQLGTRPHMRFEGIAGSGKTTAAKMLTTLLFGKSAHQNASTMAAIYETSRSCPMVCLDNIENKDLDDSTTDFIIASATRATRQKKGGSNYSQVEEQSPQCLVMTTGIESLHKNELIQRSLIVEFDNQHASRHFNEEHVLNLIKEHRNYILSGLLKLARKILFSLSNYDRCTNISKIIMEVFPNHSKRRNTPALCCMAIANRIICKYIRQDFDYYIENSSGDEESVMVRFTGNPKVHQDIFESWILTQHEEDIEVNAETNEILFYLELIKSQFDRGASPELMSAELGLDVENRDAFSVMFTSANLHRAFSKMAKDGGTKYSFRNPKQLMRRLRDSESLLNRLGWYWGRKVKKTKINRFHVLLKTSPLDDLKSVQARWKAESWG